MTRPGLALLIVSLALISAPAAAADWVSLDSAVTPPSKLQVRAARLRGKEPNLPPPVRLKARLDRPEGDGPFPAIVLLHGCYGIQPYQRTWADDLVALGYIVLQVDSYGPRRIETLCENYSRMASVGQELDAYGALAYLAEQPFVDPDRIAVLGWSVGATSVLLALDREKIHALFPRKFLAAVAFYPYCLLAQGPFVAPLLLLIGSADDWTPAWRCERLADRSRDRGGPFDIAVYPGAYHFFDDSGLAAPAYRPEIDNREKSPARGATFGHDPAAQADALERVKAFLAKHLGE